MAHKAIPIHSKDLLLELTKRYPDALDIYESLSPFERGKQAGVVQLLRELKSREGVIMNMTKGIL